MKVSAIVNTVNGILNIDKPAGMTSHDVVGRIRRVAQQKRVGHAGTLDPDATGVLLVCLGTATRLADYLAAERKAYRATLALGATTTTEDASGEVLARLDTGDITEADLAILLPQFTGEISQIPPMVSALHHEGKRLYELARQGVTVERAARTITIDSITLSSFVLGEAASATLDVVCGKGTYIRTLCADLGAALGVGGHMAALRRTRIGVFGIETAIPLDDLMPENLPALLVSPSEALAHFPVYRLTEAAERNDIAHGRSLSSALPAAAVVRIVDAEDQLFALGRADGERLHPFKVFGS